MPNQKPAPIQVNRWSFKLFNYQSVRPFCKPFFQFFGCILFRLQPRLFLKNLHPMLFLEQPASFSLPDNLIMIYLYRQAKHCNYRLDSVRYTLCQRSGESEKI